MHDDDDLMLPKATMVKAIKHHVPGSMRIAHDTTDMVMECCNNLIHMITSTANAISEKEKRATIQPEDVLEALRELGFESYLEPLEQALKDWKSERKEARSHKGKNSKAGAVDGMSQEELIRMQQELFQQARDRARGPT